MWFNKVFSIAWPFIREWIFGKYPLAEYLRQYTFTRFVIIYCLCIVVAFFYVLEQAVIQSQIVRTAHSEVESKVELIKSGDRKNEELNRVIDDYKIRMLLMCDQKENQNYLCKIEKKVDIQNLCKGQ